MQTIAERLHQAQTAIASATKNAGREAHSVKLLAVSKTKPVSDIRLAYAAGQRMFGENYVQEGVEKVSLLQDLADIEWHMIGPLQSNKTKSVAEHYDWVQTVDREKIAKRLNEQRSVFKPPLNVCIQVNLDNEETKSGVALSDVEQLADYISTMERLSLRGLMAIPKADASATQKQQSFAMLADLFTTLQQRYPDVDTLSLGMSQDMEEAIKAGSTMVRVGTNIFGAR